MSVKASNFKLGVFVVVSTLLLLVALSMLGAGALFKKSVKFETVFEESVQGLEVGSPVKSRGVQIGTVSKIGFARFSYTPANLEERLEFGNYIVVEMDIEPAVVAGLPEEKWDSILQQAADEGLRIRMASSGLTGPPFLSVDTINPETNPAIDLYFQPRSLYIPSAPSTISKLMTSVERVVDELDDVDAGELARRVKSVLASAENAIEETRPGIAEFKRLLRRVDNMVAEQEGDIEAIVVELRSVLDNLEDITENAKGNPSRMLFGDPPPRIDPSRLNNAPSN